MIEVRKRGRTRELQMRINFALASLGGLKQVLQDLNYQRVPYTHMARRIEEETGIKVSPDAIKVWLTEYAAQDAQTAQGESKESSTDGTSLRDAAA